MEPDDARSTSHPLAGLLSQSAKPSLQLATAHRPPTHAGIPWAIAHAVPHAPQCAGSVCVFDSQPLAALMSQSAKPALQAARAQAPATHDALALLNAHTFPQAPQFEVLVRVAASQPLAGLLSQSAKPALHAPTAHRPAAQSGVAFCAEHALRHAPQFAALVPRSVSHPLAGLPSQSPHPSSQVVNPQRPSRHTPVACIGAQAMPHPPQWARLVSVEVSQPFEAVMSQSAKPALQLATAHVEATHWGVALVSAQALPQAPQLATSDVMLVSHPETSARQSAMPPEHIVIDVRHMPPLHVPPEQVVVQVPQWAALVRRSTSHPFAGSMSQSR